MADKEDNKIKSNKTWIKWKLLGDGTSMKYGNKMFTKPEQSDQLKIVLEQQNNYYDAEKLNKSKDEAPKKTQVIYDEAICKINMNKTWIKWTSLKPGETLEYRSREFRKDIPDDQEKLMMHIINRMNGYDNEKRRI